VHVAILGASNGPTLNQAELVFDLYSCLRVMQVNAEFSPGNGLYPARGDQHRSILEPVSAFHIEVAKVPASLIHDKAFKDSKVPICGPHVITQHMAGAAQMEKLGGV